MLLDEATLVGDGALRRWHEIRRTDETGRGKKVVRVRRTCAQIRRQEGNRRERGGGGER